MKNQCACPVCGRTISALPPADLPNMLMAKGWGGMIVPLVKLMAKKPEAVISLREFADHIYSHLPDGGPIDAENVIRTTIYQQRQKLAVYGWTIQSVHGLGFRLLPASDVGGGEE